MAFLTSILSGIWDVVKRPQVLLIIAILSMVGAGTYMYSSALETNQRLIEANTQLNSNLKVARNNYDSAIGERDKLRSDLVQKTSMLNAYQSILGDSQLVLDAIREKMEKDKKREATVAKKPGLVTKQTQRSYNSLEDNFSCISGNMESCARLESSSQAAPTKKK